MADGRGAVVQGSGQDTAAGRGAGEQARRSASTTEAERRQLQAHLREMVRDKGMEGAALELGVSSRTLRRSRASGELSPKLEEALEQRLADRLAAADAPWWQGLRGLERRLEELAGMARDVAQRQAAADERVALQQGKSEGHQRDTEQRLASVERAVTELRQALKDARGTGQEVLPVIGAGALGDSGSKGSVHGNSVVAALVEARNAARGREEGAGTKAEGIQAAVQRLEAELAVMRDHGESWPPGKGWTRSRQSEEIAWRLDALEAHRRELVRLERRRWLRRVLTLGLWQP
ncbi:MAG: hypothetical protein HY681_15370 [Chloroflexi bacterium]|nr:hypothetical protein [Chloroflexota bacterium]